MKIISPFHMPIGQLCFLFCGLSAPSLSPFISWIVPLILFWFIELLNICIFTPFPKEIPRPNLGLLALFMGYLCRRLHSGVIFFPLLFLLFVSELDFSEELLEDRAVCLDNVYVLSGWTHEDGIFISSILWKMVKSKRLSYAVPRRRMSRSRWKLQGSSSTPSAVGAICTGMGWPASGRQLRRGSENPLWTTQLSCPYLGSFFCPVTLSVWFGESHVLPYFLPPSSSFPPSLSLSLPLSLCLPRDNLLPIISATRLLPYSPDTLGKLVVLGKSATNFN